MKFLTASLFLAVATTATATGSDATATTAGHRELETILTCNSYSGGKSFRRNNWDEAKRIRSAANIEPEEKCVEWLDVKTTYCINLPAKSTDVSDYQKVKRSTYNKQSARGRVSLFTLDAEGNPDDTPCQEKLDVREQYCKVGPNSRSDQPDITHELIWLTPQDRGSDYRYFVDGVSIIEEKAACEVKVSFCINKSNTDVPSYQYFPDWKITYMESRETWPKIVDEELCADTAFVKARVADQIRLRIIEETNAKKAARKQALLDEDLPAAELLMSIQCEAEVAAAQVVHQAHLDFENWKATIPAPGPTDSYASVPLFEKAVKDYNAILKEEDAIVKDKPAEDFRAAQDDCRKSTWYVNEVNKALLRESLTPAQIIIKNEADLTRNTGADGQTDLTPQDSTNMKKKTRNRTVSTDVDINGVCTKDHTCGRIAGDPHINTFDGYDYDCHGHGEFVLVRDLESKLEIQGRFVDSLMEKKGEEAGKVTGVRAIAIDTGMQGVPKLDVVAEESEELEGGCILNYYVDGKPADFGPDGKAIKGIELTMDDNGSKDTMYFPDSGIIFSTYVLFGNFGCMMGNDICLPRALADSGSIVGLLGSPNGNKQDEWMTPENKTLFHGNIGVVDKMDQAKGYEYCVENWCTTKEESIFGYLPGEKWEDHYACDRKWKGYVAAGIDVEQSDECTACCGAVPDPARQKACLVDCNLGSDIDCKNFILAEDAFDFTDFCHDDGPTHGIERTDPPTVRSFTDPPKDGNTFVTGDPHFKTFGGEMYDYHGECDLVLLHNPEFKNNMGMDIHIRTKIEDFWSSVQSAAIKLGGETMEIRADPSADEWLWVNGEPMNKGKELHKWYTAKLSGFLIRYKSSGKSREANVYLDHSKEPIEFKAFRDFLKVDINFLQSENYYGSTGLLGSHAHDGARLGRDGERIEDANEFGQEWQVAIQDAQMFHSSEGAVVLPNKCVLPPALDSKTALRKRRLAEGMDASVAEKACAHLQSGDERQACVYDVLATQDTSLASVW